MTTITQGYAVIISGIIDIYTVSATRRGAMVNWMLRNAIPVSPRYHSDTDVEQIWTDHASGTAEVIPIVVTAKQ